MASHLRSCKVLSQLVSKQASRALLVHRGRVFLSTSAAKRGDYKLANDNHGGDLVELPIKCEIGKREVVGFGMNGEEIYIDHVAYPFPSIRFKEDTPRILQLKEKEKGDWKKMTIEEKKELYRASFCQTLVEVKAPTGDWKGIMGLSMAIIAMGMWAYVWMAKYVYGPLPSSMTDPEHQKGQIQMMINMGVGRADGGFASHYDYENNRWKSMP